MPSPGPLAHHPALTSPQGAVSSILAPGGAGPWLGAGRSQHENSRVGPGGTRYEKTLSGEAMGLEGTSLVPPPPRQASHLLQPADPWPQLRKASSVTQGTVVAAYGLLTVVLRLIQLPELFPQPWLGWLPEQRLNTAMQRFQLSVEGSWCRCPTEQRGGGNQACGNPCMALALSSDPRATQVPTHPGA